jgi:glycosyltransferase involved in cell wall biosynthesis
MGEQYRLSIVLPAYNEEQNLPDALTRATEVAERLCTDHEIVVVDDGSSDATSAVAREHAETDPRIRLVRHPRNLGYGEALRSGFRAARMDLVFFTDADNQFDLNELVGFLPWIEHVPVVAGYRIKSRDSVSRRVMRHGWNYLVRALFYVPVRDIDCAFKLFRREVFDDVDLESVGAMVNTELMVKLGRSGVGVVEVGVTHYPRLAGEARGANLRVIARAFYELVRMYRRLAGAGPPRAAAPVASEASPGS